jgi:F-type H+-transporting ATPase subunit b
MELELGQILSQIFAFLIMMMILKKFAWKPILSVLDARQQRIAEEFATIEQQKNTLKTLQDEWRFKVKEFDAATEAKYQEELEKAHRIADGIRREAEGNVKGMLQQAKEQMKLEVAKAKNTLKNEMVELVISSTEKMIKQKIANQPELKQLIEEELQESK